MNDSEKPIILFDGICNLCNWSVRFVLNNEQEDKFLFTSLQSDAAKILLLQYDLKKYSMDSILLIEDGKVYQKSDAVLKICKHLKWPWKIFLGAKYLPLNMRNWIYDLIAKRRYMWFGKKKSCTMMIPKYKNRFI